jgi:hypothetical protein
MGTVIESCVLRSLITTTVAIFHHQVADTQSEIIRLAIGLFQSSAQAWVPSQLSFLFFQKKKYPFSKPTKLSYFTLLVTIQVAIS